MDGGESLHMVGFLVIAFFVFLFLGLALMKLDGSTKNNGQSEAPNEKQ